MKETIFKELTVTLYSHPSPHSVKTETGVTSSMKETLSAMASHFFPRSKVGGNTLDRITESYNNVDKMQPSNFPPVTDWELNQALGMLNKKASPGADGITASMITDAWDVLSKPIQVWCEREWLSENQHGFVEGKSTLTACSSFVNFVEQHKENGQVVGSVFLDIKTAFDSTWHPFIIDALVRKSCPMYLIKLIKNYLTGRKHIWKRAGIVR